jgi:hypothetical protein
MPWRTSSAAVPTHGATSIASNKACRALEIWRTFGAHFPQLMPRILHGSSRPELLIARPLQHDELFYFFDLEMFRNSVLNAMHRSLRRRSEVR